jgi:LmbE family N-acetylglucosaminyl deacetylase
MCASPPKLPFFLLLLTIWSRPAHGWQGLTGAQEIEQELKRLNVLGSVLMIGAHPDDENTAVLAYFARGRHLRAGYLSCTRGEGGQNLIGPEQGDLLGVIRTQELLAARKIDGAEQFFTRAIDFGFSKSADETLAKWGREAILSDMVWVIRNFRPDLIILRFSGTPRDGHGQHQASAILGKEAFFAAADPRRFPEQLLHVTPWRAKRVLFNVFSFSRQQEQDAARLPNRIRIDTGEFNPVLGESYNEIAGRSRSMHRSQSMGAPRRRGPSENSLIPVAGEAAANDPLEGVDTTWHRVPGGGPVQALLSQAIRDYRPEHPEAIIPLLLEARKVVAGIDDPWGSAKLAELDETIGSCAGLWLDATAERYAATPASKVQITVTAINRSPFPLTLEGVRIEGMGQAASADVLPKPLAENRPVAVKMERQVPAGEPASQPFWLRLPHRDDVYSIDRQELVGLADAPPVLTARVELGAGTERIRLKRPVWYRYVDHVLGELTRPLVVEPPVSVNLVERVVLFPTAGPRRVQVAVQANVANAGGKVRLDLGQGWRAEPADQAFHAASAGEQQDLTFEVTPPAGESHGELRAVAAVSGGETGLGVHVISYPHIPVEMLFPPAVVRLVRSEVRITARKVGYIVGAGDELPESLRQLGCEVTLLGASDLEQRNLAEFDAIVTGVRAYNVRPDLRANQGRLLEYVRQGGTMVVQYNTADGSLPELGPHRLVPGRSRVAVEDAPVSFPHPENPLLRTPNVITERDFEGWVQERGLYFASEWDSHYETVLVCHDPGEPPQAGGMLYARYGRGVYIFSAYSWFRQLPAGVPGAYRLFANILSAK